MTVRYYSVALAAKELGVAASTLYHWINRGTVETAISPSGRMVISADELERLRGYAL